MGKIRNLGTSTMRFKEGLYVSGSASNENGTDSEYSLIVSGSVFVDGNINVMGSSKIMSREVNSFPYAVAANDYVILVAGVGSPRSINLPPKATNLGRILIIKDASANANSNNIQINPDGSEDIDQASDKLINKSKSAITIICASDQWHIIGYYEA